MKRLLTVVEVSQILNIAPNTVRRLIQRGEIKGIKIGRLWRISEEEIERISKEGTIKGGG